MPSIIPVVHCFDNNYVIAASVSFLSMLKNASKDYFYKLYVLHSDITESNQLKLHEIVSRFDNASLEFINAKNKLESLIPPPNHKKAHYSNEMYYKLLTPSLFPQYDKILLTDVDVVFRGDISRDFMTFDIDSQYYVAGVGYNDIPSPSLQKFLNRAQAYQLAFGPENVKKFLIGAGYLIFNLTKMRKDNIEEKFTRCLQENIKRLGQPEQDVINLCCAPYIKLLPVSSMVCTYFYDIMDSDEQQKLKHLLEPTVQLHYATSTKPWNTPSCTCSHEWFSYLLQTPFFYKQMEVFNEFMQSRKVDFTLFGLPLAVYKKTKRCETVKLFYCLPLKGKARKKKI